MSQAPAKNLPPDLEEESLDPHGFHKGHHGHVILSPMTLFNILALLLFFTVLTVFVSRAEGYIADLFDMTIPHWVNVTVALSIATVKSVLVALYFMQLKYDAPLNSLIFLFCLFALCLFLGFTTLDLGTLGAVYSWKADSTMPGGDQKGFEAQEDFDMGVPRAGMSITAWAAQRWKVEYASEKGWVNDDGQIAEEHMEDVEHAYEVAAAKAHGHEHHDDHGPVSNANISRAATGRTPGLFGGGDGDGHGDGSHGGASDEGGGH